MFSAQAHVALNSGHRPFNCLQSPERFDVSWPPERVFIMVQTVSPPLEYFPCPSNVFPLVLLGGILFRLLNL